MIDQLTYLNSLKESNYTIGQKNKWKHLCDKVNRGDLTMNQAYLRASSKEYMEEFHPFNQGFTDWMETAKEEGWISSAFAIANNLTNKNGTQYSPQPTPTYQNADRGLSKRTKTYIGVGIALVAISVAIIVIKRND